MRKVFCVFCVFFASVCMICAAAHKAGAKVFVCVKAAELKDGEDFFSKTVGTVAYGDNLTVIEGNQKKTKVKLISNPEISGWIPNGSITSKKVSKSKGGMASTSSNEMVLAGKGFSEEAEKAFKSSNKELNYDAVDEVEKIAVTEEELSSFITEGHLKEDSAK